MAAKIHELRAKLSKLTTEANTLEDAVTEAVQGGNEDQIQAAQAALEAKDAEIASVKVEYETEGRKNARLAAVGSTVPSDPIPGAGPQVQIGGLRPRAERDPRYGFESHRDFLTAVMAASRSSRDPDERLAPLAVADEEGEGPAFMLPRAFGPMAAAGSDEQGAYSDSYGGFLVPTQVLPGLLSVGAEDDPMAGRTTMVPMTAPIVKINARTDKKHTTSVAGGLTFTRTPETAAATSSRMQMEQITLDASPLVGLAYATEQILTDSPVSFAALLAAGFQEQRGAHILNERIRGGGGNEYLGVLNSPALVTVAKESGQAADTIVYKNVLAMRARAWRYGASIWIANHDTLPQLAQMSLAIGTGGAAVFLPNQLGTGPAVLLGRPLFFSEYASTVGDVGDIMNVNPTQYLEGIYQPMRTDESIHVRFVNLERTFRFYERNAGAPWWRSALTPNKGANTLSPFVTLAARA